MWQNKYTNILSLILLVILTSCQNLLPDTGKNISLSSSHKVMIDDALKAKAAGDHKRAASLYQPIVKDEPDNVELRIAYADSLRLSSDFLEANKNYDYILNKQPSFIPALEGKALASLQQGDLKQADLLLNQIINQDAARWRTVNALGVVRALEGNMDDAKIYYKMAIDIDPANSTILNNIGLSMALTGSKDESLKILLKALNLANKNNEKNKIEKIELNLALVYGMKGDFVKSKELLSKYLPEKAVYNNLGVYAALNNDKALARDYLTKAISADSGSYTKAQSNQDALSR